MKKVALYALAAALLVPSFANAAVTKAGKWQITIESEMPGMPMKMPPITMTHCVTPEQAENPEPPKGNKSDDCKISDYKIDGNTVSWRMSCEKQKMTGKGNITYSPDSYEGEMRMNTGEMVITQKYHGKYLGACDK
jgi:hypothetical protein